MTVGKPDFNLNSFGIQYKEKTVKYTEDLINKFGKEAAAKREPENTDPNKENQHTLQGFERTQNGQPTVKRQTTGRSMRRMVDGKQVRVPSEGGVERKGNDRVSTQGDVVNARAASPATVSNAQQMITDNPTTSSGEGTIDPAIASGTSGKVSTWNDGLPATTSSATGGKTSETAASESDKEDKEDKFINDEASKWRNSPAGKKSIAAREKREAAILARGGTINHAASEINAMTDGMKELMKDDKDDKDFAIRERNYEALGAGGGKPDNSLLLDVDKPAVKKIKKDAEETVFKAISLKLDLM